MRLNVDEGVHVRMQHACECDIANINIVSDIKRSLLDLMTSIWKLKRQAETQAGPQSHLTQPEGWSYMSTTVWASISAGTRPVTTVVEKSTTPAELCDNDGDIRRRAKILAHMEAGLAGPYLALRRVGWRDG